jgi:hypothetical protein
VTGKGDHIWPLDKTAKNNLRQRIAEDLCVPRDN